MADATSALAIKDYSHHQMILPSGVAGLTSSIPSCLSTALSQATICWCPRFRPGNPKKLTQEIQVCPARAYTSPLASKFLTLEEDQYLAGYVRLTYLVGYFLAKLWERDFKDEGSVITESIVNHNMGSCPRCESRSIRNN